ncbi:hypothetical protein GCM10027040_19370 [Halomonas shantousis]
MSISCRFWLLPALAALGGCQALSPSDPLAVQPQAALPEECQWQAQGDSLAWLRATSEALEAEGYVIRDTDAELGLVSAERSTAQPGLGAVDRSFWGRSGFWGSFGLGGRHGYSLGYFQRFGGDPVRIERVSVTAPGDIVRVTRDSQVVDIDGYLLDARPDMSASFCQRLRESIESRLARRESQLSTGGDAP